MSPRRSRRVGPCPSGTLSVGILHSLLVKVNPLIEASSANWELAIVLPLGVVANQLLRMEAELRVLNMKVVVDATERENTAVAGRIAVRLEQITEALDRIQHLVSAIEADIRPRTARPSRTSPNDDD